MKQNSPILAVLVIFGFLAVLAIWFVQSVSDFEKAHNPNRNSELSKTLSQAESKYFSSPQSDYTQVIYLKYDDVSPAYVYSILNHECDVFKVADFTYVEIPLETLPYKANSVIQVFYTGNGTDTASGSYYELLYKDSFPNNSIDANNPFLINLTCTH
jgi:hypothetical protein